MIEQMTALRRTRRLDTISHDSLTFREFQAFIESQYFARPGGDALARTAANDIPVPPRSGMHVAVRVEPTAAPKLRHG